MQLFYCDMCCVMLHLYAVYSMFVIQIYEMSSFLKKNDLAVMWKKIDHCRNAALDAFKSKCTAAASISSETLRHGAFFLVC